MPSYLTEYAPMVAQYLLVLCLAAILGAAVGLIRPARRETVPSPTHILQAQILLAVVGAIIIVVVAESLERAVAIVSAAGLVRHRAAVKANKERGLRPAAISLD